MAVISAEEAGGENIIRLLDTIAFSEGTSTHPLTKNDGYDVVVSGIHGPEVFTDYMEHPFSNRPPQIVRNVPLLASTAAGRYQLLLRYYKVYKGQLGLQNFSPLSQDKIAIQQIKERKAIAPILSGDIEKAIVLCSGIWASLPGNHYEQGGKTLAELTSHWNTLLVTA